MRVLEFTLLVCSFTGCWQPNSWTSLFKHIIYKTYAMFLVSALYIFSFSQFMNIMLNVENSDEFTDSLYMMLTVFVAGYKQVYMWIDRKNIMMIINFFYEKPFAAGDTRELMIQQKFDKIVKNSTLRYLMVILSAIISITVTSVFTAFMSKNLTYKAWVPFHYSHPVLYFLVYCHQLIGMAASGIVNAGCEGMICGLLLNLCCQLEILEYRLTKMADDENILRDCVYHHNRIFECAYTINNMFAKIIGLQFASLQFASNVFNVKWSGLSNSSKKGLLIIMKRATIPIEFSSAHIITMNLESFVALLKTSYSAFNLLHQMQE
ncbi:uncharacterized protein LOC143898775 isoform X2 [Temnothorax americanus]|uniref:uncharacterized protein LOC143898775 isoform X2 n=1 Tax=Temnothorax americanus TaxID=1964332 RepID=UPI00406929CD